MKKQYKLILFLFALLVIVQFSSIDNVSALCDPLVGDGSCCTTDGMCIGWYDGGGIILNPCQVARCDKPTQTCSIQSVSCEDGESCEMSTGFCVPDDIPSTCGDDTCDFGEEESCPGDCPEFFLCGDGVCDFKEEITCPQDCIEESVCGNGGDPEDGEQCDDGDTVATVCTVPAGQTSCIYCSADCQNLINSVDSTTCTTTPAADDIANGNKDVKGGSTLTTTYTVSSPTSNTLEDSCSGITLTEHYCDGPVGSQTRESRPVTCSYDCQAGACVDSTTCPTVPCSSTEECISGACEEITTCPTVPCSSTQTCNVVTGACYEDLTCPNTPCGTGNICISGVCITLNPVNPPTCTSPTYGNGICESVNGEDALLCPLDCFDKTDGFCDGELGENHYNSPTDCGLTSDPKLAWINTVTPYQEIIGTVSIDKEKIDEEQFIMTYMITPLETGLTFEIEGFNDAGIWEVIHSESGATDSDNDTYAVWTLKYQNFWDLGFSDSETEYKFRFQVGTETSKELLIELTGVGNIPTCNDGDKNGAEEGEDCGGECGEVNGGLDTCEEISWCQSLSEPIVVCEHYDIYGKTACNNNDCINPIVAGRGCEWDEANDICGTIKEGAAGTCHYIEINKGDTCDDGYFSYEYTTNFIWKESVTENPSTEPAEGYVFISEGVYYKDREGEKAECGTGGSETIACPAQIKLSFWTWQNIIATIALIFLGYYVLDSRKKKVVKKKIVTKKKKKISKKK